MSHRIMRYLQLPLIVAAAWGCGGGCVAYQIRDELRTTNHQLEKMSGQLDQIEKELATSNQKLEKANHSLGVMESSMDPIRVSLRRIDDELMGFREMIDKIDRYIPLNIKADTPRPAQQAPTRETTPQKH